MLRKTELKMHLPDANGVQHELELQQEKIR